MTMNRKFLSYGAAALFAVQPLFVEISSADFQKCKTAASGGGSPAYNHRSCIRLALRLRTAGKCV